MENTRISLAKVQIAKFASEETTCFGAQVYFDGKKIGDASNDGHGACTFIYTDPGKNEAMASAEAYAREVIGEDGFDPPLAQLVDQLLASYMLRKDATTQYRRASKTKAIYMLDGQLFNCGAKHGKLPLDKLIDSVRRRHPDALILNLLPESQAIDRYVAAIEAQA